MQKRTKRKKLKGRGLVKEKRRKKEKKKRIGKREGGSKREQGRESGEYVDMRAENGKRRN